MSEASLGTGLLMAICGLLVPTQASPGALTDGSLGPVQSLSGAAFTIPEELGTAVGSNLFHSFSSFGIDTGESATFTAVHPFTNVISRVTGGGISSIDGLLRSTVLNSEGRGANVWLINPAGIVFGANALLQVKGGFHASTADYLKLGDCATAPGSCGQFNATDPGGSTLAVASPSSFGFLDPTAGAIQLDGANLQVPLYAAISLTGGDISVTGGGLYANSGTIDVTSVAGAGEIDVADPAASTVTQFGSLSLSGANLIADELFGLTSGGRIFIRGGALVIDAGAITANHAGSGTGGGIVLTGTDSIAMTSGATVAIAGSGSGSPGTIVLNGGDICLAGGSTVRSEANGLASGPAIGLSGGDIRMIGGGAIYSTGVQGDSGDVTVTATGSVVIDGDGAGQTGIISAVQPGTSRNAGSLRVQAGSVLSLLAGGVIGSQTAGAGSAGQLNASATTILIDGTNDPVTFTGITSQAVSGATGISSAVTVDADSIAILGGGEITSDTFAAGAAGQVSVTARSVLIDGTAAGPGRFTGISAGSEGGATGNAGAVLLQGDLLTVLGRGAIATNTSGSGAAGDVTLVYDTIIVSGAGSGISSASSGAGPGAGRAGNVALTAGTLTLAGGQIAATTADGAGGAVTISTDKLELSSGAQVDVATSGTGNAGAIDIGGAGGPGTRTALVTVAGAGSGIVSTTSGAGDGGEVTVLASALEVTDGATISAASTAVSSLRFGQAGSISVDVTDLAVRGGGEISTSTFNGGDAGQVLVSGSTVLLDGVGAPAGLTGIFSQSNGGVSGNAGSVAVQGDRIEIRDGGAIGSNTDGSGNAGDITVSGISTAPASQVTLTGAGSRINSLSAGTGPEAGRAGSINLTADQLALHDQAGILASTVDGAGGAVTLDTQTLTVTSGARVSAETAGAGDGGAVTVLASSVEVADGASISAASAAVSSLRLGQAGSITLSAIDLAVRGGGEISTSTYNGGDAGDITLSGGAGAPSSQVTLTGAGSRINSLSAGTGPDAGQAGSIKLTADHLTLDDQAGILASTVGGAGGAVTLDTNTLWVEGGARISAETAGSGNAGAIAIGGTGGTGTRTALVMVAGAGSGIVSSTSGAGDGGEVTLLADSLTVTDGASIAAASTEVSSLRVGPAAVSSPRLGQAGSITVDVSDLDVLAGGSIGTTSASSGGGNIAVLASGDVLLDHGAITASAQGVDAGDSGGNVSIARPRFLILDAGEIRADANAGRGGNITIDALGFVASADSIVSASSAQSVDGQVTNTSENTVGTLLEVDVPAVATADPIRTRCTDTQVQNRSSLVVRETRPGMVRSPWLAADSAPGVVTARNLPCDSGTTAF